MKIVIATGGTGGHLFPAIKVASQLKDNGCEVVFMGAFNNNVDRIRKLGYSCHDLEARGLVSKGLFEKIKAAVTQIKSIIRSRSKLKQIGPDTVVGFGGYGAFPVVFAAWLSGIPAMIHEQNVVPGLANRILSRLVKKVAISFECGRKYFKSKKVVLTGCPCLIEETEIDKEIALEKCGLQPDKMCILIVGGSQGSSAINREVVQALELLKKEANIQVFHITGKNDYEKTREAYALLGINAVVHTFFEDMALAYAAADLVVARSGACTVTELALMEKRSILIPYPFAGGHQKENAKALSECGLAVIVEEKDLSAGLLKQRILDFIDLGGKDGKKNSEIAKIQIFDADKRLSKEILGLKK